VEKVIAALWKPEGQTAAAFNAELLNKLGAELNAAGARLVRLNLQDEAVAGGATLARVNTKPQMHAIAQLWMPSANDRFRGAIDTALGRSSSRVAAWVAVESTITPNDRYPPRRGERTHGFSQATFLGRPTRLSQHEWLHLWQSAHTPVAIETQANFEHIQHVLVNALTDDAPEFAAFVEECFPLEALTDPHAFFDAVGDKAKLERNRAAMMESCTRFVDFDKIDVLITSQFEL
jgi:hypothetical protein